MKRTAITAFFCLTISFVYSQVYNINTVAGNGTAGYSGDGGPATAAELNNPYGIATDTMGNVYVADQLNDRIRKIDAFGKITTVAGDSVAGYSGDGGPATAAKLNAPYGVAVDASGNIYIADQGNNRIRKVNTGGVISTIAGTGIAGYSGDGGAATLAKISVPYGVGVDTHGNVYIADFSNNRIRKIDTSGIITTVAGNGISGYSGDGGPATAAELFGVTGVSADTAGNIYIADNYNSRIRIVNTNGIINTVAGDTMRGYLGDGGPATDASLFNPSNTAVDMYGNIYIADRNNEAIRMVNTSGIINAIAGTGIPSYTGDGGPATTADLYQPSGVAIDNKGNIYIADEDNNRIRKLINVTGVASVEEKVDITIFPNPNHGKFVVQANNRELGNSTLKIYDAFGKEIYSNEINMTAGRVFVNVRTIAAGIYLYRLVAESGISEYSGKLLIE